MRIIEINALSNGAHRNQSGTFSTVPEGWARIPDDMTIPETFPFVNITVEGNVVTAMEEGIVPEPDPFVVPEPEPSADEILNIILGEE